MVCTAFLDLLNLFELGIAVGFALLKGKIIKLCSVMMSQNETHLRHCEAIQADPMLPHVYGVKRTSLLNSLQYFNISDNFSVDVMHDVLEGIAQFELKLVLSYVQAF